MKAEKRIVVWDPLGEVPEGELIEGQQAATLVARRVASLPIDHRLFGRNGLSGWNKRAWGKGVTFDPTVNKRGCPIVLYVLTDRQQINFVFRLMPDAGGEVGGRLRLATDANQVNCLSLGVRSPTGPIQVERLGKPDKWGGWTVEGTLGLTTRNEGFFGLSLYGKLTACRVMWLAVSQT